MSTWFQPTMIDGRECTLVLPGLDWAVRPKISRTFSTEVHDGRSGIEAVASDHHVGRLTLSYHFTFEHEVAEAFRDTLLQLGTDLLAMPIECDRLPAADYTGALRIFDPRHYVNYNATTGAYLVDGDGGYPETAGLVLCSLVDVPRRKLISDTAMRVLINLEEDSPWDARVGINPLTMAAWDLLPDWAMPVDERSVSQLTRSRLGKGRETITKGDEAPMKVAQQAGFTLRDRDAIRRVLTFWEAKRGAANPFTVPLFLRPVWGGQEGTAPSVQARFGQDVLQLDFASQEEARTRLVFREQLLLQTGQPSQKVADEAWAVKLWWHGAATVFAWTDWESPLTLDGQVYEHRAFEVKPPVENLRPGTSEWELLVANFVGCPLRAFSLLRVERRLQIEIRKCDPSDADGTAAMRFGGTVINAARRDKIFQVQAALFGGRLTHLAPDSHVRTTCCNVIYDDLCGEDPADHEVAGVVAAVNDAVIDITGGAAEAAEWFNEGYLEVGAGDSLELRYIAASEQIAGGQRLTINRPLQINGVSAAVQMLPGCDGQYGGGCAQFGNQDNFFGANLKPAYIESVGTTATRIGK